MKMFAHENIWKQLNPFFWVEKCLIFLIGFGENLTIGYYNRQEFTPYNSAFAVPK